jgi:acyl carrier protein
MGTRDLMVNSEKYHQAFIDALQIDEGSLQKELEYNSITEWDSIGHMALMAALEDTFDIMMDMDDIIDFSSYEKGLEIVRKYGIEL